MDDTNLLNNASKAIVGLAYSKECLEADCAPVEQVDTAITLITDLCQEIEKLRGEKALLIEAVRMACEVSDWFKYDWMLERDDVKQIIA